MPSRLTPLGHLTESQKEEARKQNIDYMDYIQIVLKDLNKENTENALSNKNTVTVECKNPVIIIGHGPDWEVQTEKIRGTKIPIIVSDVCSIPLMDMGIIPTYIVTYEEAYKRINEHLFDFKRIDEHSVQVIGSKITKVWMDEALNKINMDLYRFTDYDNSAVSNVGIMASMFAERALKADKLIFIGMNSWAKGDGNPYLVWFVDWRKYLASLPPQYIINCTQAGLIYDSKVLSCDFNNLVIK